MLGAAVLVVSAGAPASARVEAGFAWRRIAEGGHGQVVSALAVNERARLALGDARGVSIGDPAGGFRRLLHRGGVRDLAFLGPRGEALLAATDAGLYRVESGVVQLVPPTPGAEGRSVRRIAVAPGAVAVVGESGAYLSEDGRRWRRVSTRLPLAAASAVALRETDAGIDCAVVVGRRLWQLGLARSAEGWRDVAGERQTLPFAGGAEGPVDVLFDAAGADTVVVFQSSFAVRSRAEAAWEPVRPALPPGARARRLHAAHGLLWLATDSGLLFAENLAGPWERAAKPAGSADVRALASDADALYVAAGEHVLAAQPVSLARAATPVPAAPPRLRTPEGDPPIEQVHRAALAYLDLRPDRMAGLRRGVARRGWLPIVSLRLARARDRDDVTDADEAFTSGALRRLVDRESSLSRDFEASLSFSWDLGDVAYHPEQIDVSRESREVIRLRDDVLDEVTQLYFERRRVLAELAARPTAPPDEKLRLRLRAAELAAGIDAWTGGWFQRARSHRP